MIPARKLLLPSMLICALTAALFLAATASAEVRVGEATRPVNPSLDPEADVIGAKAEYNSDTGAVKFEVTTAAAPSPGTEADPSPFQMIAGLANPSLCSNNSVVGGAGYPSFGFTYQYLQPNVVTWALFESAAADPNWKTEPSAWRRGPRA